ncbi:MoaD/ThiS family protein [Thiocapsa rosea]|uniref:Molybdopterin synthase subunit MoaD n=1 Tax=Thiocapsa rosea TaxID=69360 RepID=A0A495VAV1_9GAMM|nr:MoaD/ThiS family protein [Thiocapsa rosea]RKT44918.1 molybdopterin synthase subunit MoaD [Thiocapsa rosea]
MTTTTLSFTPNLSRHLECSPICVEGSNLRDALEHCFRTRPDMRGFVLDDQGAVRRHVAIFINETLIRDRRGLSDPIQDGDTIFVAQALSGG